uniref:Uncharacterized protein n=1 Tax=Solanum lycopersicum TaxID=4081 RepID=A0A3Q7ICI9_SOLLC
MPPPYAFYQLIQQFLQFIQIWYSQTTYLILVVKEVLSQFQAAVAEITSDSDCIQALEFKAFPVQQVKTHCCLELGVDPWCTYEDWSNVTNLFVSKSFLSYLDLYGFVPSSLCPHPRDSGVCGGGWVGGVRVR